MCLGQYFIGLTAYHSVRVSLLHVKRWIFIDNAFFIIAVKKRNHQLMFAKEIKGKCCPPIF